MEIKKVRCASCDKVHAIQELKKDALSKASCPECGHNKFFVVGVVV